MAGTAMCSGMTFCLPTAVYNTGTIFEQPAPTSAYPNNAVSQAGSRVVSSIPTVASAPPITITRVAPRRRTMASPVRRPAVMVRAKAA